MLAQPSPLSLARLMVETAPTDEIAFRTLGGSGPDCVFIHGFGSDRLSWLGNTLAVQRFLSVHTLDLPGHGESGTDVKDGSISALSNLIEHALDARKLKNLHIVGHSLGGAIALVLAASRPDLVASLSLIAPVGLGQGVGQEFLTAFPELDDVPSTIELLQSLVTNPKIIGKQIADRVLLQLGKTHSRQALRFIAAELNADQELLNVAITKVMELNIPRLVIWGAADDTNQIDQEHCNRFGGELQVVDNARHLPHIENAKTVNAHLSQFLSAVVAVKVDG